MTRCYGKLLGGIVGALLFRPTPVFGALAGLLLGHAFDRGWFKMKPHNPYRAFDLTQDASDAEVDQAYRRLIRQVHPDRMHNAAPEAKARAEARARELNAAYDRIKAQRRKRAA